MSWPLVALLGGGAAVARVLCASRARHAQLGTLAVNVTGTFALGLLTGLGISGDALLYLGTGVLGSFTTFSTWMLETERFAEDGEPGAGAVNLALSVAGGLTAAAAGWALGSLAP